MTLILSTLLIIIAIALVVVYFQVFIAFVDFFMVCSSEDLSLRDSMAMWSIVKRNKKGQSAVELFEDTDLLNRCIMTLTQKKVACSEESKKWTFYADLLDILYEIRQKLAQKINSSAAVSSSLDLPEDSALTLSAADLGGGTYQSKVLSNNKSGMVVSYPVGPKLPFNFSWRGKQVLVSVLVEGVSFRFAMTFDYNYWDQSFTTLRLLHSDSFSQEQRRASARYNVHIPALFTIIPSKKIQLASETGALNSSSASAPDKFTPAEVSETAPQTEDASLLPEKPKDLRSVVKNLSIGGCQVLIGGNIPMDTECKLLLRLNGHEIPTQGITRLVKYIETDDFSYVRIQFTYIESEDLRKVCSFIYGIEIEKDEVPPTPQENSNYYDEEHEKQDFPEILKDGNEKSDSMAVAALRKLDDKPEAELFAIDGQTDLAPNGSSQAIGELEEELQGLLQNIYSGQESKTENSELAESES